MRIQTPASHRNDPETSFIAEEKMNKGKRFTHQRLIAEFVQAYPGYTAAEIGYKTELGQHECSRRLSELTGISVFKGVRRKCNIKHNSMVTWYPNRRNKPRTALENQSELAL